MSNLILVVKARIFRDGLAAALALRKDLCIVDAAADAASAIVAMRQSPPDVMLIDIASEGALELAGMARSAPAAIKVIALAIRADDDDDLMTWAEAGAVGFVTCENSISELLACIDWVMRGPLVCSPRVSAALLGRVVPSAANGVRPIEPTCLTPRQTLVLQLLRLGHSNKQIARELAIEPATVKNHVHQVLQRLQVRRRREAAAFAPGPAIDPTLPAS